MLQISYYASIYICHLKDKEPLLRIQKRKIKGIEPKTSEHKNKP